MKKARKSQISDMRMSSRIFARHEKLELASGVRENRHSKMDKTIRDNVDARTGRLFDVAKALILAGGTVKFINSHICRDDVSPPDPFGFMESLESCEDHDGSVEELMWTYGKEVDRLQESDAVGLDLLNRAFYVFALPQLGVDSIAFCWAINNFATNDDDESIWCPVEKSAKRSVEVAISDQSSKKSKK